jgi:hypothetical protein
MGSIFSGPSSLAAQAGDTIVNIHRRRRFTDSTDEVLVSLSQEINSLKFRWNRLGGCGKGSCKISLKESLAADRLVDLGHTTTEEGDLYGDIVSIWVKNFPDQAGTVTGQSATQIYMGKVRDIEYNPKEGTATINFEGLSSSYDNIYLEQDFEDYTIKQIMDFLADLAIKTNEAGGNDGDILAKNIWAPDSVFDMVIPDIKAKNESASSVLKRVLDFVPGRFVWGVDRTGTFFFLPQDYPYPQIAENPIPVEGFFLDQLLGYKRSADPDKNKSIYTVKGKLDPDTGESVVGTAVNQRQKESIGPKKKLSVESDITDSSLCAKLAQVKGRLQSRQIVKARAKSVEFLHPDRSFRSILRLGAPSAYINESENASRTFGDVAGNSLRVDGKTLGESFDIPNVAGYNRNREYMFHISITFEAAHGGGTDFVFGMPDPNAAVSGKHGWGYLSWDPTGALRWNWTSESAGNPNSFVFTGITVPTAGPFPITKHITVAKNASNTWLFFDGPNLVTQIGVNSNHVAGGIWAGPFTGGKGGFAGFGGVKATFDNFWFYGTGELNKFYGNNWLVANRVMAIANYNRRLQRNWLLKFDSLTEGLVAWAELCEKQDGRTTLPVKYPVSGTVGEVALSLHATTPSTSADRNTTDSVQSPSWFDGSKWGGPVILDIESVEYTINPIDKTLTKDLNLGSKELGLISSLVGIETEVREAKELLKKRSQDV